MQTVQINKPATFTDASTNNPTHFDWDFGDGVKNLNTTSSVVTHTYSSLGTFTSRHVSSNSSGISGECIQTINVVPQTIISNIVALSGKAYTQDMVLTGKLFYIDRTYTFTIVPAAYSGLPYIVTATDDRYDTRAGFLQFDINASSIVYVAFDDRISPKPSWLTGSFVDTGANIVRSDSYTFSLYSKSYSAGHVSLGGNSVPSGGAGGMYVVIVKPTSSPTPTLTPTPTPAPTPSPTPFTIHLTINSDPPGAQVKVDGNVTIGLGFVQLTSSKTSGTNLINQILNGQ